MNQQVLLSNVTANATLSSWSQAYSTLNFYLVVSLWKPMAPDQEVTSLTPLGKDLLDRLPKEFFSFDEKSLENTKLAVTNALQEIEDPTIQHSIVLATIKENTLYLVLSSGGKVLIRRGGKFGVIASGEKDETIAFSGEIEPMDLIVLETQDFSQKFSPKILADLIDNRPIHELAESITPYLHTDAKGSEAAMFLEYKPASSFEDPILEETETAQEEISDSLPQPIADETPNTSEENPPEEPEIHTYTDRDGKKGKLPQVPNFISIPTLKKYLKSRKIIGAGIILLGIVLIASIGLELKKRTEEKKLTALAEITSPAQKRIDEANTLMELNITLALEELTKAKTTLSDGLKNYKEGSNEHAVISDLLKLVDERISQIEEGSQIEGAKELVSASGDLGKLEFVSEFEGTIAALGEKGMAEVSSDGTLRKNVEVESTNFAFTQDTRFYYLASNEKITRTDKGNSSEKTVDSEKRSTIGIDVFGGNIYALQKDGAIVRFAADSFSDSSYFKEEVGKPIEPAAFSIDGSVYVLQNNGDMKKYTRGILDPFGLKGVVTPIGQGSIIDSGEGYSNLYVLDRKNKRIIVIEKNGNFKTQYQWNELQNASSFAVDEKGGKAYSIIKGSLYQIPLQ